MSGANDSSKRASHPVADRVTAELMAAVARLEADNARLRRLLTLTPREAARPGPVQAGWFEAPPGGVNAGSPVEAKVAFYAAMLDALAYLKAARASSVPAALEVSRSGLGAHVWVFFTAPVPAETARQLGTGLPVGHSDAVGDAGGE